MQRTKNKGLKALLRAVAAIISVLAPALAVLFYFPLWQSGAPEKLLSGGVLLLLIICAVPLFKILSRIIKTPAAHTLWLIIFIAFYLLSSIAEQMTVISFTGFLSNAIGALIFKLSERVK